MLKSCYYCHRFNVPGSVLVLEKKIDIFLVTFISFFNKVMQRWSRFPDASMKNEYDGTN